MSIFQKMKKMFYHLNIKPFLKNYIIMESNPDFADNPRFVFEELIRKKYNEKYKIIWFITNQEEKFQDINIPNVKFINRYGSKKNRIICKYYNLFAKYIIDCNRCINKLNKYQKRVFLSHGLPLKLTPDYNRKVGTFDYTIQTSNFFTDIISELFLIDSSKIATTGFPRTDILLQETDHQFGLFPEIKRKKVILWLPTYRNHKTVRNNDIYFMDINFKFGVPSIDNEEQLQELNEFLKENEVLLLIKLHPAEDDSKINALNLSHIKIIKDSIFDEKHLTLYHLLSEMDAMITDYSSLYYDFMITKKPIGLAISDIDEYKKHVGLLFENYEENVIGEYIYQFDDLKKFIKNVATENDITYDKRMEKLKIYHQYTDGASSNRIIELLGI